MKRLIDFSLKQKAAVVVIALLIMLMGVHSALNLPLDAFPDTTPVMVHVNAEAEGLGPLEIEEQILRPLERTLLATAGVWEIRSLARFGFGQIILIFTDGTKLMHARQSVLERLNGFQLVDGLAPPELGPPATGMGEVFHYTLSSPIRDLKSLMDLQRYELEPRLASVSGVAEINAWGGLLRRAEVLVDLKKLRKYDLRLKDVFEAIRSQVSARGGGGIALGGEYHLIQGDTRYRKLEDIENAVVSTVEGIPVLVSDIGQVIDGHALRRGAVSMNAEGEVLLGLGFMSFEQNGREVSRGLEQALESARDILPEDVSTQVIYSRETIVNAVLQTAGSNLVFGSALVFVVLLVFLGDLRAGLIVALSMPFCLLFAFCGMRVIGIPGTLMSLGAIDFGLVVDSSVILVENTWRRLRGKQDCNRDETVSEASMEMRQATIFGELILILTYLPILFMAGAEGKLFRPMAITIMLALAGSFLWSIFIVPVLSSWFLKPGVQKEARFLKPLKILYLYCLKSLLPRRKIAVACAFLALIGGGFMASRLGARYLPRLEENTLVLSTVRMPGISLEENLVQSRDLEAYLLRRFPHEIRAVLTRIGSAELATDPMGLEQADVFLDLFDKKHWKRAHSQVELQELVRSELESFPGIKIVMTQPIEMRMNEMEAGIRSDVGILIYGENFQELAQRALEVEALVKTLPDAVDVSAEKITGGPMVRIQAHPSELGRYGLMGEDVLNLVEAIGGVPVNLLIQGEKRYDVVVRLPEEMRQDPEKLGGLQLMTEAGGQIRLDAVSDVVMEDGPVLISRERTRRRVVVQASVAHSDVGGFVTRLKEQLERSLEWNTGLSFELGGQFRHYESARRGLVFSISLTLILIFFLLQASTGNLRDTFCIMSGAPFAALGGILALSLMNLPFSISAGVGFVIVCGVSMLNGLVMISTLRRRERKFLNRSLILAALERLQPVLMTALVAFFGFLPMVFSSGIGAEIQRPLAVVVAGGVISDTLLTLLILPCLLGLFHKEVE